MAAMAALLTGSAALLTLGAAPPGGAARAPALDADFPDPFVLADTRDGVASYWAYATNTRRDGKRVHTQLARSADGLSWSWVGEAMPALPGWVNRGQPDVWAPEVARVGDRYLLYFTGRHASLRRRDGPTLCIGAAVAANPAGPFVPEAKPLLCDGFRMGVIDATVVADAGRLWMIAKTDGNCCGVATRFVSVPLTADGLATAGPPTEIAGVFANQRWEGAVVEAPTMVRHDGQLYLFYSANDFGGANYAAGYARCDTPAGPCEEDAGNPILSAADATLGGLNGPGHQSLFQVGGRTLIAYHGWVTGGGPRRRALFVDELRWEGGRARVVRTP